MPRTVFTLSKLPNSYPRETSERIPTSLGFSISKTVVPVLSTSYPATYALPFDILMHIKSSSGVFCCSVSSCG